LSLLPKIFTTNGLLLTTIGESGNKDGQLYVPRDLVVDSQQRIIVSDGSNNRVQVFTPTEEFKKIQFASKKEIDIYIEKMETFSNTLQDALWNDLEKLAAKKYIWNDERIWSLIGKEILTVKAGSHTDRALDLLKRMLTEVKIRNPTIDSVALKAKILYLDKMTQILGSTGLYRDSEKLLSKQIIDVLVEEGDRFKIYWSIWKDSAKRIIDENDFMKQTRYFINDLEDAELNYKESILEQIYEMIASKEEYDAQHYEGASTLYGPHTLAAYLQTFEMLAAAMLRRSSRDQTSPFRVPGVFPKI